MIKISISKKRLNFYYDISLFSFKACWSSPCFNGAGCKSVKDNFVCSCLSGYFGSFCQSKVLNSTVHTNSTILTQEKSLMFIENITKGVFPSDTKYTLIYQATKHGFLISDFHSKCDGILNTLMIIKTSDSYVFGGFTTQDWSNNEEGNNFKSDSNAFLFSLVNPFNQPVIMKIDLSEIAIRSDESSINFGYELVINDNSEQIINYAWLGSINSYRLPNFLNQTGSLLIGNETNFLTYEIEVYSLNLNRKYNIYLISDFCD